jgi:hypothetical protein
MFTIRQSHKDEFRRRALERFSARAISHLRTHLSGPTSGYSDDELRRRVNDTIARSSKYGLRSEQEVMCFLDATFLLGEGFDTDPAHAWAGRLLGSDAISPSGKASVLLWTANVVHSGVAVVEF